MSRAGDAARPNQHRKNSRGRGLVAPQLAYSCKAADKTQGLQLKKSQTLPSPSWIPSQSSTFVGTIAGEENDALIKLASSMDLDQVRSKQRPNVLIDGAQHVSSIDLLSRRNRYRTKHARLACMILSLLAAKLPDFNPFDYNGVQINYNAPMRRHTDDNNIGKSYCFTFGDHSGGELVIYEPGENGREHIVVRNNHRNILQYDGRVPHSVQAPGPGQRGETHRYGVVVYRWGAKTPQLASYEKCTHRVVQAPNIPTRDLTDKKFRWFLNDLLQKRRAGEVFAGKGTVGQAWEDAGGTISFLMEKKPHAIQVLQGIFPNAIIWRDKPKTPLTRSELLVLFGGPPCNDFSKAGRQRGQSRDVLWCFELAAQMRTPFLMLEITPEFMWNDSQHGQYTYLMSRLPELGYQMVSHVVDNPDLGGGSYRRRLLIEGELTCISKLLPPFRWPQLSRAGPQPLLCNLDSISSLRGTRNFASEGRFELFEHPRRDKRGATTVGVLRWGAGLPIEQGSCVYCFARGCQGTWRVVSVIGSRVRLMAYNQPKVGTRVTVSLNSLKAKDQSLLVYGISGCGLSVTSYNEGIQGSGRILILDTRLGHNFVRILTNTEVWRLVSEAPIPEGLIGSQVTDLAGASITTPMARFMAVAIGNRIDQLAALTFPVTKISLHGSIDHPARVVLLPLCVASTTCLLDNDHYVGCGVRDRSHAHATLKHLWRELDPSSIYFLVREFANSHGKIFVYAVLCKQETPIPGFSWLRIEKCGDPHVAVAWDRLQSMGRLGTGALLKNLVPLSGRCHPLLREKPLAARVPVAFRRSDNAHFLNMKAALNEVSRSCSSRVRQSLGYWGDAFSPPDMRDVAPEDLKTQLAESPIFATMPFSEPCPIPCTKPLSPYQFGNPPGGRYRLEDLLFPWALRKMDAWFKEERERFRGMWEAPGTKCPPGRALVIGSNGFKPSARGFLWRRVGPNMYEAFSRPESCSSHWDLGALDDILASYPDKELRDFVRCGVSYKIPLVSEIRLLPHLTTLGLGAHKLNNEIRRLRDLGWSQAHEIHDPPCIPIHFIPRGATARKHEPDRPRGTSDFSAPHKELYNTSRQSVLSFNRQTNHKYFHWATWLDKVCDFLGDELDPYLLLRFNQIMKSKGQPIIDTAWEKEFKPSVDDHVKDVAILKAMADEAGEQLNFFVDDFKDFFMQFVLAPHQRYLCCTLWFDAAENFKPILSEEMRMAFGASPNSKIAQRFSNVLAAEFTKRFNKFVRENMESLSPGLRRVIAKRDSSLNHATQWQASPMRCKIFTDDAKFAVIGSFLTAHALRIWTELTVSFNMLMAIPAKRAFSQSVKWLGLMWHAPLAIVTLPKTRRMDLLSLLHQFISREFLDEARNTFDEYRSMVGKPCVQACVIREGCCLFAKMAETLKTARLHVILSYSYHNVSALSHRAILRTGLHRCMQREKSHCFRSVCSWICQSYSFSRLYVLAGNLSLRANCSGLWIFLGFESLSGSKDYIIFRCHKCMCCPRTECKVTGKQNYYLVVDGDFVFSKDFT